ncbi:MAG TPA: bifunctional UDP-N-acetylglucosamine diphosphorylase/glucosamine-1-phosphate N-acetyltransferase GlmU [Cellvibrionaceae bacterium]
MLEIIILAAGKGTRMKSNLPKVMHLLAGRPLVQHVIDRARELSADKIHLVVGHGAELVESAFAAPDLSFSLQSQQLGTGHAVLQALDKLQADSRVLILYGDVPLIRTKTLTELIEHTSDTSMGLLTVDLANPFGYGRIVRDANGAVTAIVEQKDATHEQLLISEGNSGVMAVTAKQLRRWLPQLSSKNAQGEYYLTDVIALAAAEHTQIKTVLASSESEVLGVNDRAQQAQLERAFQLQQAQKLMQQGLTLLDPHRFDVRGELTIGQDCVIDINCIFEGVCVLGDSVEIGPNCIVKNARIGAGTHIYANSTVEDSQVDAMCSVGPYARLRPGTHLKTQAKIGNFVETKKAVIGEGSKVNHLSYIGDAFLGDDVNVGAGTITCNYDGVNKHITQIGNNCFVGANSTLVAPIKVGDNATIAAGSTITTSVHKDELVVARTRQKHIEGWQRPAKKK